MMLKRACAYIRLMEQAGTDDPYVERNEPPVGDLDLQRQRLIDDITLLVVR